MMNKKLLFLLITFLIATVGVEAKPKYIKWKNDSYTILGWAENGRIVCDSKISLVQAFSSIDGNYFEKNGNSYIECKYTDNQNIESVIFKVSNDDSGLLIADKYHKYSKLQLEIDDIRMPESYWDGTTFINISVDDSLCTCMLSDEFRFYSYLNKRWMGTQDAVLTFKLPLNNYKQFFVKDNRTFMPRCILSVKELLKYPCTVKLSNGHTFNGLVHISDKEVTGYVGTLTLRSGEKLIYEKDESTKLVFSDGKAENDLYWESKYQYDEESNMLRGDITYTDYHNAILRMDDEIKNAKKAKDAVYKKLHGKTLTPYQADLYRIGIKYVSLALHKKEGMLKVADENKVKEKCYTEKELRDLMSNAFYYPKNRWPANEYRSLVASFESALKAARSKRNAFEIKAANSGF